MAAAVTDAQDRTTGNTERPDQRPDLGAEFGRWMATAQDWARRALPDSQIGHGGPECQWCPICQFVNLVRGESPEVAERLAQAGSALAAAVRALADTAGRGGPAPARPRPAPRVQRIDLDDTRER
jgi:hypothetical protein